MLIDAAAGQPYMFRLVVNNRTSRSFHPVETELRNGRWNRGGVDNAQPIAVGPREEVEVMGIWMPPGKRTGYECRVVWRDDPDGARAEGGFGLTVVVPFFGATNRAGLDVTGPFTTTGWTGIPRIGHDFCQTLTIREVISF